MLNVYLQYTVTKRLKVNAFCESQFAHFSSDSGNAAFIVYALCLSVKEFQACLISELHI